MRGFIICSLHQILLEFSNQGDELDGTCSIHGEMKNAYKVLVGKPEGKRLLLWRLRHRWEGNIKMDLTEVECEGAQWIQVAQNRVQLWALMNMVMNLQVT
jgi:hypothetical protein